MPLHRSASVGFSQQAEAYRHGRPDYPAEVAGWLRDRVGLGAGRAVVEIGAGTGKFTPWLRDTGAQVTAIEPVAAMREQFALAVPDVAVIEGAAEAIPLPDESADAVICAQCFHWFATAEALAEMRRVLRPGGVLGLIWNVRDDTVDWVAEIGRLQQPLEGDTPRYYKGDWKRPFPADGFGPLEMEAFPYAHVGPIEQVLFERTLSSSFIAAQTAERRDAFFAALRDLVARHPALAGRGEIAYPYRTEAFNCRRTEG